MCPAVDDPDKYRLITCLPTMYKILNGTIASKAYTHTTGGNHLTSEQMRCREGSQGTK